MSHIPMIQYQHGNFMLHAFQSTFIATRFALKFPLSSKNDQINVEYKN